MSNESFPRVHRFIGRLCASDANLHHQFTQLEDALKEKETLSETRAQLEKDKPSLHLDLMLVRKSAEMMHEHRVQINNIGKIMETSYDRLLQMAAMLDDDRFRNMQRFVVLRKQTEVQTKLCRLDELQRFDIEYKNVMENRIIVKDLRKWQSLVRETEQKYSAFEVESEQLERQWHLKIRRATEQRNEKIVALAQLRQQIAELEVPLEIRGGMQALRATEHTNKASAARARRAPVTLQSAVEFFNKYPKERQCVDLDSGMDTAMTPPLHSILLVSRTLKSSSEAEHTVSPIKQVHFAPLPSPLNDTSNMPLYDLNQMMEVIEVYSAAKPNNEHLPEHAIVEKVEVFPPLSLSASTAPTAHETSLFPANELIFGEDSVDIQSDGDDSIVDGRQPEDQMQPLEDDIVSMGSNDLNALSFRASSYDPNEDLFFILSNGNSTDPAGIGHSFEL